MSVGPFFSNKDDELLRNGSVRDCLGLVPVWSKVARKLEPNLSGAIGSYHGLQAVLFIYYLEREYVPETLKQRNNFRDFFRYMEALVEYYLFHHLEQKHCYGTRLLKGNGPEVEIKFTSVTTVNGLYQFYRGTCRRAGMLSSDWVLDEAMIEIGKSICNKHSSSIKKLIKIIVKKVEGKDDVIKPLDVFCDSKIAELFESIFRSSKLKQYINKSLYSNADLKYYASACSVVCSKEQDNVGDKPLNLAQRLQNYIAEDKKDWPYFSELKEIYNTEPFLSLLDDCFQLLHLYDGRKLTELATLLAIGIDNTISEIMKTKAQAFKNVILGNQDYETGRFSSLSSLASLLEESDIEEFLIGLLNYHQNIMNARGAGSMILFEDGKLHVLCEVHTLDESTLLDSISDESPWKNSYYINTSAHIYNQLEGAR